MVQINDFNIKESSTPKKEQFMAIPQKPSKVFDCINNVHKVLQPPSLEIESHSNYRDNYYNTIRSKPNAFYKINGYFSYFSEQTKREREMNDLYSRKNLSKFQSKVVKESPGDRKEVSHKLKKSYQIGRDGASKITQSHKFLGTNSKNSKYMKTNGWMSRKRNSSVSNTLDSTKKTDFLSRRASSKV